MYHESVPEKLKLNCVDAATIDSCYVFDTRCHPGGQAGAVPASDVKNTLYIQDLMEQRQHAISQSQGIAINILEQGLIIKHDPPTH